MPKPPKSNAKKPSRRKPPAPVVVAPPQITPEQAQAFLQAALYDGTVSEIALMRDRLKTGDCPATITEPERRAAVVDLERGLAQLRNLHGHYWPGPA